MTSPNILQRILAKKQEEVIASLGVCSMKAWQERVADLPSPKLFSDRLREDVIAHGHAVICEIKKASPSQGIIRKNFDAPWIAKDYSNHGATVLSVLTDESFFMGSLDTLRAVRQATDLPLLRKDFIIHPVQIYEARAFGADAILLIVAALSDQALHDLWGIAMEIGLSVLIEVHDEEELSRALKLPLNDRTLIGVNNRNLKTFAVSLETIINLKPKIPLSQIGICESGIHSKEDVARMKAHNINTFLIGEAFMRADSPGLALQQLFYRD